MTRRLALESASRKTNGQPGAATGLCVAMTALSIGPEPELSARGL